ncbi:hypothetical protein HY605_05085, partial [Candidatus Peregrinibacteria bacterium]|nr:hypothetical protein [Candidatus Peregrinibacteria bacterium]
AYDSTNKFKESSYSSDIEYNYDDGYEWAKYNDISDFDECQSQFSTSTAEDGCNEYVKENYSGYQTFYDSDCTEDCSGHEAGYEWAEENDIEDEHDCDGNSESFNEGCRAFIEENTEYLNNNSNNYNPFEDRWESASDSESLNYNAFEDNWEYTSDSESLKFNAFEDEWQYANDNESLNYNSFEDEWEYAPDDASLNYDPFSDTWSYE